MRSETKLPAISSSSSSQSSSTENVKSTEKSDRVPLSDWELPVVFLKKRHLEPTTIVCNNIVDDWRPIERMKTVSVALVMCMNFGVDPPDIVKTAKCARMECWIDPANYSKIKVNELVGFAIQRQYEFWQPRARYKQTIDPTVDDIKKLCLSLRRTAKDERLLFHYNGHGVPKPTSNGEIWGFNKTFTQYIPLSIYELQTWVGSPTIFVYDCSSAGTIIDTFKRCADQHQNEWETKLQQKKDSLQDPELSFEQKLELENEIRIHQQRFPIISNLKNCIHLAACSTDDILPMTPDLPADLFTCCLTCPIKTSFFLYTLPQTVRLTKKITLDDIDKIPGQLGDRRTMLGELNWIFTAITDTIAWNTLPRAQFQRLFRQDLLVASLFRNFLLAERIMRRYDCKPISDPQLPRTHHHRMWDTWCLTMDKAVNQLADMIERNDFENYTKSTFFEEQLTSFEVWLDLGPINRNPPEQLPIILQVLLSQTHRIRALRLLSKFLDMGSWAVKLSLSVGIFPYVLKLLQSTDAELRPYLAFIWAKILAVDKRTQIDLIRDKGHLYFVEVLKDNSLSTKYRTLAAYILANVVNHNDEESILSIKNSMLFLFLDNLITLWNDALMKQWLTICLAHLWQYQERVRWSALRDNAHEKIYPLLTDIIPETRAAAVYALGTLLGSVRNRSEHANKIDQAIHMQLLTTVTNDMSPMVRNELLVALQWSVLESENVFLSISNQEEMEREQSPQHDSTPSSQQQRSRKSSLYQRLSSVTIGSSNDNVFESISGNDRLKRVSSNSSISSLSGFSIVSVMQSHSASTALASFPAPAHGTIHTKIWQALCQLDKDPYFDVLDNSAKITNYIRLQLKEWNLSREAAIEASTLSLPPSPNSRLRSESANNNSASVSIANDPTLEISEEQVISSIMIKKKLLVQTSYFDWMSNYLVNCVLKGGNDDDDDDNEDHSNQTMQTGTESARYLEKEWRYYRNSVLRKEAIAEQKRALKTKFEWEFYGTRTTSIPSVMQFHPYDQQIAVAGGSILSVYDWATGAQLSICNDNKKTFKSSTSKITSIDWLNSHDFALISVASEDGAIRIWQPAVDQNQTPKVLSAWQAYNEQTFFNRQTTSTTSNIVLTKWEQSRQTLITAGTSRFLRLWDIERELRLVDYPTGTDYAVTALDTTYSLSKHKLPRLIETVIDDAEVLMPEQTGHVIIGCADGSLRLFDRRCSPQECRVRTWREHCASIIDVKMIGDIVSSACANGFINTFDIRRSSPLSSFNLTSINTNNYMASFHPEADIYACTKINHIVSINGPNGKLLNVISLSDGYYLNHNVPATSCLIFHPKRVMLAIGSANSSILVYCMESKK